MKNIDTVKMKYRKALLKLADLKAQGFALAVVAAEAEKKKREHEAVYLDQQRLVIQLWKESHPGYCTVIGHTILPDGQIANIQEGSVTFWEVDTI